ncbi:uncharacterized protein LOC130675411 [Microplitis mediator]|uniref:uncharacterized protein LOC130675411 n=1 Tax=Microplitis mediator TaxID=375433 RepID=UPI00255789C9|nr:uncharacterized protein LOC130675411 [Microplitis mediator]
MAQYSQKKFSVVRFTEPCYTEAGNLYLCVPESWIRNRFNENVVVAYPPLEEVSLTTNRILNNETPSNNWVDAAGVVEYQTEDFYDALLFISEKFGLLGKETPVNSNPDLASRNKNTGAKISTNNPGSAGTAAKLNLVTFLQVIRPMILNTLSYIDLYIQNNQQQSLFNLQEKEIDATDRNYLRKIISMCNEYNNIYQRTMQNYLNLHFSQMKSPQSTPSELQSSELKIYRELLNSLAMTMMVMNGCFK